MQPTPNIRHIKDILAMLHRLIKNLFFYLIFNVKEPDHK